MRLVFIIPNWDFDPEDTIIVNYCNDYKNIGNILFHFKDIEKQILDFQNIKNIEFTIAIRRNYIAKFFKGYFDNNSPEKLDFCFENEKYKNYQDDLIVRMAIVNTCDLEKKKENEEPNEQLNKEDTNEKLEKENDKGYIHSKTENYGFSERILYLVSCFGNNIIHFFGNSMGDSDAGLFVLYSSMILLLLLIVILPIILIVVLIYVIYKLFQ